jgi:hypothetical protein
VCGSHGEAGKRGGEGKINVCVKLRMGCLSEQYRLHHLGIECVNRAKGLAGVKTKGRAIKF